MVVARHSIIYIYDQFYEKIYLYICITCTICSIVKYQQTKKCNGKYKNMQTTPNHTKPKS